MALNGNTDLSPFALSPSAGDGDWGHFADEQPDDQYSSDGGLSSSASSSDSECDSSSSSSSRQQKQLVSTSGLAELNKWLWDSCELGVAAWIRSADSRGRNGRRRCYFMTGGGDGILDNWRCTQQPHLHNNHHVWSVATPCVFACSTRSQSHHHHHHSHAANRRHVVSTNRHNRRSRHRGGPHQQSSQQLWCVSPFEPGRVRANRWETIETAMTPRLCPRVFSREFSGGIIVGASFGSIRVVANTVTGIRHSEFLLMVSVGEKCRRSWRRQSHFSRYVSRHWARWSPACRGTWTLAENDRRWIESVDDFHYTASRHAWLEAVLREILFSAESPAELIELAGDDSDDLGPPPSLAEVKMRARADDVGDLPANDEDYAALFGGELATSTQSGLKTIGEVVAASLSCAPHNCAVASCQPHHADDFPLTRKERRTRQQVRRRSATDRDSENDEEDDDVVAASAVRVESPQRAPESSRCSFLPQSLFRKSYSSSHFDQTAYDALTLPAVGQRTPARRRRSNVPAVDGHVRRRTKSTPIATATIDVEPSTVDKRFMPPLVAALRRSAKSKSPPPPMPPSTATSRDRCADVEHQLHQHKVRFARTVERHPLFAKTITEHAIHGFNDVPPPQIIAAP